MRQGIGCMGKSDKRKQKEWGMNLTFDFDDASFARAKIKVVGVGGAGCNAVMRMIAEGLAGVDFIAINTDEQALEYTNASTKIKIGTKTTKGLGAGADPEKGRRAVEEDRNAIYEALAETDMAFIAAGMGGGTGTGAAPVVAGISRDMGILTVGIVTKPFLFEGPKRMVRAEEGIIELKESVDTLIVIPNQRLLSIVPENTPLDNAFRYADEILYNATKGIADLVTIPGLVNLDFADVKAIMSEMGDALMGAGVASGPDKAKEAAEMAIHSPLLEDVSISGARGVLVNITGGIDLSLHEVNRATSMIFEEAGPRANIIFGAVIDKNMQEEIRITVIATGLSSQISRYRIPGLNRQFSELPKNSPLDKREIPAVDRYNEIGERLGNETSNGFILSRSLSDSSRKSGDGEKGGKSESKNDPLKTYVDHDYYQGESEHKPDRVNVDGNGNGFSENDFDIPACRRKKWSLL